VDPDAPELSAEATSDRRARLTALLGPATGGERAWDEVMPLVYDELRALAQRRMSSERAEHTLQATGLVNEAWMRLMADREIDWKSRRHFFGAAAEAMRRVLVDHARRVRSEKRGGDRARVSVTVDGFEHGGDPERVLALDDALDRLAEDDPRAAEVVRLRFFAGLEVLDVARALEISERTVMREWAFARARLTQLLGGELE
jgi:RNA polymerase sigma factor (TIGR02999 family)